MQHDDATPREIADRYVETLADLNPIIGTSLGIRPDADGLPDLAPAGHDAIADAERATLAQLDAAEAAADGLPLEERRAAKLLRERLTAALAVHDAGENLRNVGNLFSPVQSLRSVFLLMPTESADDWAVIGRRLRNVPAAVHGYRASLDEGISRGLRATDR